MEWLPFPLMSGISCDDSIVTQNQNTYYNTDIGTFLGPLLNEEPLISVNDVPNVYQAAHPHQKLPLFPYNYPHLHCQLCYHPLNVTARVHLTNVLEQNPNHMKHMKSDFQDSHLHF